MSRTLISLRGCRVEVLTQGDEFRGLGRIWIGSTLVRSGRLPLRCATQSFAGQELAGLRLLRIRGGPSPRPDSGGRGHAGGRIELEATFRPLPVKLMRDHSFDPIHETGDWDRPRAAGKGRLDLVVTPARDEFNGVAFEGCAYHWEYRSREVPLFYLLDQASWELDGDITGATVFNQSSCSAPVCTFGRNTAWSTEGIIHWQDPNSKANPVMTHNLPRWASHQAFDFQCKGDATLVGVYERVDLIRSLLVREPGRPELKTLDKHLFNQTGRYHTATKKILLNRERKTLTGQRNVWTWVFDAVADRARAEFGLKEEPLTPRLGQNYWMNWTLKKYDQDLLPAARAIGIPALFIDNVNRSDYTEATGYPEGWTNMCGGHEYEPGPKIGGSAGLRRFVKSCAKDRITPYSWTNNDQSALSPHYLKHRPWFVRMEDARLMYGGAYTNAFAIWSFANPEARKYWVNCLKQTRQETGLKGYLFDSFYNLGFMPVDYTDCTPRTQWREILQAFKELQDADVHFMIESFGPFGEVQHGCPTSYNLANLFACYKIGLGTGYTTVPTGQDKARHAPWPVAEYYRVLAHMTRPDHPLFYDGVRIDKLFTAGHKQALADYRASLPFLCRRHLQEDGQAVLWHDRRGTRATLFNFRNRRVALPGRVFDLTSGKPLPKSASYSLQACRTYVIRGTALPVVCG